MIDRRGILKGVGTVSTVAIAGCSQASEINIVGGEPRPEGPEAVVKHYFTAIQNEDVEAANEVFYPESPAYPLDESDISYDEEITAINEVEERSIREVAQSVVEDNEQEPTEEEINKTITELEQAKEERINELGVDDTAYVYISYVLESDDMTEIETVVQSEGTWYIPALVILGI